MLVSEQGGGGGGAGGYTLVGVVNTFRVNQNNTTTPIVQLTASSAAYLVTFTWDVTTATYLADGGANLAQQKVGEVDAICGAAHVQGFRTEQEQDASQILYNYAVITVGTDDQAITDQVSVRMDHIGQPAAFAAIAACWERLVAAGAPASGV